MNSSHALLVKANRMLGSQLVESGLISYEALEEANEKFLDALSPDEPRKASLLRILLAETKTLEERSLIEEQVDNHGISPCSLERIHVAYDDWPDVEIDACFATRTIPVDRVDDVVFIATSYYLSRPVREYWNAKFGDLLVWTVAPFAEIEERLNAFAEAR